MRVLVQDPLPLELEALLERRRVTGADRFDEVWEGVLHMNPAPRRQHAILNSRMIQILGPLAVVAGLEAADNFNLGEAGSYRIPDCGLLRPGPDALYLSTAALVVEILSPNDETWDKLPFYAAHEVDELLIVDPQARKVNWLALDRSDPASPAGTYRPVEQSALIDLGPARLTGLINWQPTAD